MTQAPKNFAQLKTRLRDLLPADRILDDVSTLKEFSSDWTGIPGQAALALFPISTFEVKAILSACSELNLPVVPSGGRTGLSGGAVALNGAVVLSLSKMDQIRPVDSTLRRVRVQAGAITENVHEHCRKSGLIWPVDLASKGTCHVGGNLSTNAGGVRVVRYGMTRQWVSSIQAVTAQGEELNLSQGLEKDNVGYNLMQLILGSEGTLAVITEAILKLVPIPKPEHSHVFLFSVGSLGAIERLFESARTADFEIVAFEFFSKKCSVAVEKQLQRRLPLKTTGPYQVLMEIESYEDWSSWMGTLLSEGLVLDGVVSKSSQESRDLWMLREGISESLARTASLRKFDLSVPFRKQAEFLHQMLEIIETRKYALDPHLFGHFGDGSPHINLLKPENVDMEMFREHCDWFEKELTFQLQRLGGSLSAEHGVGLLRKEWLRQVRTEEEKRLYREIKRVFDPKNLLNPGKVVSL